MGRRTQRVFVLIVGLATTLSLATTTHSARAEPAASPTTDPKEMARRLGEEALTLHGQGRFRDAYERFETAEKIAHSPVFVLWMARSKKALGELLEAKRLYEKVASETLGDDASAKWLSARDDAKAELSALSARIPKIQVEVAGATSLSSVDVDGSAITPDAPIEMDPGHHIIKATALGHPPISRTVDLEEGQPLKIVKLLFSSPTLAKKPEGSFLPGGIVLGVGLVSLATGAATGGAALVLSSQIKDGCVGNECQRSDQGKADTTKKVALASSVTLVAGGVLSAVGTVLLIVRPRIGSPSPPLSLDVGPFHAAMNVQF